MIEPVDMLIAVIIVLVVLLAIASTHLLIEKRHYVSLGKRYNRRCESLSRAMVALTFIDVRGHVADVPTGVRCRYCNATGGDYREVKHPTECPVGIAVRTRLAIKATS